MQLWTLQTNTGWSSRVTSSKRLVALQQLMVDGYFQNLSGLSSHSGLNLQEVVRHCHYPYYAYVYMYIYIRRNYFFYYNFLFVLWIYFYIYIYGQYVMILQYKNPIFIDWTFEGPLLCKSHLLFSNNLQPKTVYFSSSRNCSKQSRSFPGKDLLVVVLYWSP